ncbi:DNA polymerase III subunit delta [uncultured Veillonella sp.]|uniref:DNA polymerase III subunit delta n=1 Tax=uncultured Veillonella sp. TaxID=159268 RepID=UPI002613188B|nr:DNA polymerase III subunit delta [uncultured Veillonella sp.]
MTVELVYGDESQLIEEKKIAFLKKYKTMPAQMLNDELGPSAISEVLSADSLFAKPAVYCVINPQIFAKTGKKVSEEWQRVYDILMHYNGENPVLIIYHDSVDKRLKGNSQFLKAIPSTECARLKGDALLHWIVQYCKSKGYTLSPDGMEYMRHLLELWQDVPVAFMRTEFDRYFLLLPPKSTISRDFLLEHGSDFSAKNIFLFKEALFNRKVDTLMALFPYMLQYKEVDRAMSYIEGQLRLQLMVNECASQGMTERQVQEYFKNNGSTVKAYPIKLAYGQARRVSTRGIAKLLRGLYEIMRQSRRGEGDLSYFKDLCLSYCAE